MHYFHCFFITLMYIYVPNNQNQDNLPVIDRTDSSYKKQNIT